MVVSELLRVAERLLTGFDDSRLKPFLALWPGKLPGNSPPSSAPPLLTPQTRLPVLEWLPTAAAGAPDLTRRMCEQLSAAAGSLAWRQTYAAGEAPPAFLERYGWCEFIGPRATWRTPELACGCLLLGPETLYPPHRHEAEEIYVPLSGTAAWQRSSLDWQQRQPGAVIHHAPFEAHAMRTGAMPLLALYLWRGPNLDAAARLDA